MSHTSLWTLWRNRRADKRYLPNCDVLIVLVRPFSTTAFCPHDHTTWGTTMWTNLRMMTASVWVIPMKPSRCNTVSQKWQSSCMRWMLCSLTDVLVITYKKTVENSRNYKENCSLQPWRCSHYVLQHVSTPIYLRNYTKSWRHIPVSSVRQV